MERKSTIVRKIFFNFKFINTDRVRLTSSKHFNWAGKSSFISNERSSDTI